MKTYVSCIALMMVLAIPAFACAQEGKEKKEKKAKRAFNPAKLVGEWTYESGKRAGEEVAAERLSGSVKVTKKDFTLPAGPDMTFVMAYKIDASKTPATIDLEITAGPVPEGKAMGIIRGNAKKFTLCYDPTGQTRPKKFESTADNGSFLFVLKKKKAE